ncbi:MAG: glycosyltransferase [Candidatus Eisenbacteria bacterium]
MTTIKVSAAMIVRDEEAGIWKALQSLRDVVDEIIIMDTGSADQTMRFVAKVDDEWRADTSRQSPRIVALEWPWQDDFAMARNEVQSRCTGDWIVVLDGDEVLDPGNLREVLERTDAGAVIATVHAHYPDSPVETTLGLRAYRKDRCSWRYPVHNQLVGWKTTEMSTAVVHASYSEGIGRTIDRVPILKQYYIDHPEDPHAPYFLAKVALSSGDFLDVKKWCEILAMTSADNPLFASFWVYYVVAEAMTTGFAAARGLVDHALRIHPSFPDLWHLRANLDMVEWVKTSRSIGEYTLASTAWAHIAADVAEAGRLLGFMFRTGAADEPGSIPTDKDKR